MKTTKTKVFLQMGKFYLEYIALLILLCNILSSCQDNSKKDQARKIISDWMGKEIKFPDMIPNMFLGNDSSSVHPLNNSYKILLYVDSLGCMSCKLSLSGWKKIIAESDSLFPNRIEFLFFFQPTKKKKELFYVFRRDSFNYPIFIDVDNKINTLNHLPSQMEYQCFLLEPNNKVALVGNPVLNPKIWILFKQYISKN
ncbi:MAG: hypothetical protein AB2L24_31945 [Mangrovibacterium sp.]